MRSQFNLLPAPGTTASPEPTEAPQPAMPTAAAFSDASRGLAVGGDASGAQLWRTSDGGGTWAVSPLDTTVAGALAVSGSRAWVVVSRCPAGVQAGGPSCTTAIERSADRGATWTVIGHDDLTSIAFGDATHGFGIAHLPPPSNGDTAAGLNTAVFATADGGGTWTKLAQDRPCGALDPVSVSFVSATHGWLGCEGMGGAGEASKGVMETTDGGRTWAWRSRVYGPSGSPTNIGTIPISDYLATISMASDGSGFITGGRGSTFRTTDGGRTWTASPPGEFDAFATSQATIAPGGPWYLIQSGWLDQSAPTMESRLMRSADNGATWAQVGGLITGPAASTTP